MATFSGNCGKYTIILNVSEAGGSVDIGSNTSKVSWSLQFRSDTGYCQWNPGPGDFEVRINGGLVWSAQNPSLWFSGYGQTLTIASGTTGGIGHNSDGTKTVWCEAKYIQNSVANYLPSSGSCGGNLGLSTIPRASSFSSIVGNTIGESQTINIDRKSSNFTNNLWYKIGSGDWISIGTGIATSKTWTLPTSLNNEIPNATSLTLTYLLRTYSGNTQIGGDVTYNFNVNYSGEKPTAGTTTITYSKLFNNKFIANYSSGTIKYSGYAGVYGSTVKSAQVIFNGSWKGSTSYDTGVLTAGTHTFQGIVTDSRENSSYTTQQSFTCYQINNPTISINAYRSDSAGNANPSGTYITIIPTYSAHDPVGGNSIKSNSFTCTSLMTTGTAITSGSKKILSGAAVDSQYVISGTVTDQLGRTSAASAQIGTAFAILDVRPDQRGMSFGKYSTGADKFEVAWDAYFDKNLKVEKELIISGASTFKGDIVDKFGNKITNNLAIYDNSEIDPNTTLETLILTNHTNSPTNGYWYIQTMFHSNKSLNTNRAQIALPYNENGSVYHRYYYNNAWTNWRRHVNSDEPKVMIIVGSYVRYGTGATAVTMHSLSQIATFFNDKYGTSLTEDIIGADGLKNLYANYWNADGGASSVHVEGATQQSKTIWAVFDGTLANGAAIRINYCYLWYG